MSSQSLPRLHHKTPPNNVHNVYNWILRVGAGWGGEQLSKLSVLPGLPVGVGVVAGGVAAATSLWGRRPCLLLSASQSSPKVLCAVCVGS